MKICIHTFVINMLTDDKKDLHKNIIDTCLLSYKATIKINSLMNMNKTTAMIDQ